MSSSSTFHSNLSKTKSKDGNGRYIIQILERLTKVETQVSHLASKEDMANLRTDMADIRADMADTKTDVANIQTQISHLASKEDMANLRTSFYKGLLAVIFSAFVIVSRDEIKAFLLSIIQGN